jgi:hypothetical protein
MNNELIQATHANDVLAAQRLLAAGADPNSTDDNRGTSALAWAVRYQRRELARLLLAAGANPNCEAASGADPDFTVLMQAAHQADLPTVLALVTSGAEINHQSGPGATPLMWAVHASDRKEGCLEIIKGLLTRGADPNQQDALQGQTALIAAVKIGQVEVVETLLAHGADFTIKDKIGATACTYAIAHPQLRDLFLKHGADPKSFTTFPGFIEAADAAVDQPKL